ncbi:MAG: hypothetical protein PHE68_02465 [Candidatus Peribacteraceae bacterium]|nr:hypothetical protein [Candidatus Peribacteraceae bacterium]MDD5074300.1 hypothetical protein [Candidatus Peribacteraceae bacterium]
MFNTSEEDPDGQGNGEPHNTNGRRAKLTRKVGIVFQALIDRERLAPQRTLATEIGVSRGIIGIALKDIARVGGFTSEKNAITPEGKAYMRQRLDERNSNGDTDKDPIVPPLEQSTLLRESGQEHYRMAREIVDGVICGSWLSFHERNVVTPIRNRLIDQVRRTLWNSPESGHRAIQLALELLGKEETTLRNLQ